MVSLTKLELLTEDEDCIDSAGSLGENFIIHTNDCDTHFGNYVVENIVSTARKPRVETIG